MIYRATYGPKGNPRGETRTHHFDPTTYDYDQVRAAAHPGEVVLHVRPVDSTDAP